MKRPNNIFEGPMFTMPSGPTTTRANFAFQHHVAHSLTRLLELTSWSVFFTRRRSTGVFTKRLWRGIVFRFSYCWTKIVCLLCIVLLGDSPGKKRRNSPAERFNILAPSWNLGRLGIFSDIPIQVLPSYFNLRSARFGSLSNFWSVVHKVFDEMRMWENSQYSISWNFQRNGEKGRGSEEGTDAGRTGQEHQPQCSVHWVWKSVHWRLAGRCRYSP